MQLDSELASVQALSGLGYKKCHMDCERLTKLMNFHSPIPHASLYFKINRIDALHCCKQRVEEAFLWLFQLSQCLSSVNQCLPIGHSCLVFLQPSIGLLTQCHDNLFHKLDHYEQRLLLSLRFRCLKHGSLCRDPDVQRLLLACNVPCRPAVVVIRFIALKLRRPVLPVLL